MKNILKAVFNLRLFAVLVVFFISQFFFVSLVVSSYNDYRVQTAQDLLQFNINNTAMRINNITAMGRNIQNYQRAMQDLYDLKMISKAADVFIADKDGRIVVGKSTVGLNTIDIKKLTGQNILLSGNIYLYAPFFDITGHNAGFVLATLGNNQKQSLSEEETKKLYASVGLGLVISTLCFIVFFILINLKRQNANHVSSVITLLIPFFIAQMIIIACMTPSVIKAIDNHADSLQTAAFGSVSKDFSAVTRLNISLHEVSGFNDYFIKLKENVPFIDKISLTDEKGNVIAGDSLKIDQSFPIISHNEVIGSLSLTTKIEYAKFVDLGLNLLTLFFISALLAYELTSLLRHEMARMLRPQKKIPFEPSLIRPLGFLIIFGAFLPVSIVPVFMGQYADDLGFLSSDLVKSLAVSTDMTGVAISSLLILFCDKALSDWKKVLPISSFLLIFSTALCFLSFNAYSFLLGRLLYGIAYGGIIVSCQLCVMDSTDDTSRAKGMSAAFAGLFSGVLCGVAAGGIIADKFNMRLVFAISCAFAVFDFLLLLYIMKHRTALSANASTHKNDFKSVLLPLSKVTAFIKDPKSLSLMLLQVIPYSAIGIGFFNFFLPVTVQENGMGASTVGQLNFLYSFLVIILAPIMGKVIDKIDRKYVILSLALLFSALVPLAFKLPSLIGASILAMILLGISASINEGGQPAVMASYEVSKKIGPSISIKVLDSFLRLGQIAGPLIIAVIMSAFGTAGFSFMAITVAVCAMLFFIIQHFLNIRKTSC
ncbi:MFS transporter [uncultured Succinatimonas sp.]|uniref:MFS transporter n=1 Tax=uncultured Succinatimonas sp. TaxID=1262973 RepID=UPI0025D71834|nr:MFS transporter [uncultured Succinatimonas sp.]